MSASLVCCEMCISKRVTALCEGHEFYAKGKAIIHPGFKGIEDAFRNAVQKKKSTDKNNTDETASISEGLHEGMEIAGVRAESSRHYTSPPKPYSEDTLLLAMERAGNQDFDEGTEKKGLGTPATRASILEKLVSSGYAKRSGKQILPTADGRALIAVMPDDLKSAAMTAEWENKLLLMEKGKMEGSEFLEEITDLIDRVIAGCSAISGEEQSRFHQKESIGTCPVCGNPVYEGKKNFYCSSRECSFALWKENRYLSGMKKLVDKQMAVELLEKGRIHAKDFYSQKTGRTFAANLLMEVKDGRASFSLEFPKKKGSGKSGRSSGKQR